MIETELPTALWILLGVNLLLTLLTWVSQLRAGGRLRRLEARLSGGAAAQAPAEETGAVSTPSDGADGGSRLFDQFLAEDASRVELPKKEQFAAFRKWRNEKGLNWSSDSP